MERFILATKLISARTSKTDMGRDLQLKLYDGIAPARAHFFTKIDNDWVAIFLFVYLLKWLWTPDKCMRGGIANVLYSS